MRTKPAACVCDTNYMQPHADTPHYDGRTYVLGWSACSIWSQFVSEESVCWQQTSCKVCVLLNMSMVFPHSSVNIVGNKLWYMVRLRKLYFIDFVCKLATFSFSINEPTSAFRKGMYYMWIRKQTHVFMMNSSATQFQYGEFLHTSCVLHIKSHPLFACPNQTYILVCDILLTH